MQLYNKLLDKYPLLTKSITSGIVFSAGDAITQTCTILFTFERNINFFIAGAAYIAPCLHMWYCKALPRVAANLFPDASKTRRVINCMLFDQLLFAPILLTGFYVFNGMVIERSPKGLKKGLAQAKEKLWETMIVNWKIWPIATTINFWLIPLQYQVLFANMVGLFWNILLSYIASK